MEEIQYKNQLFNNAIDNLFNENISLIQLKEILQKEEIINFFILILNEFGSNPDDIKEIFNNNNPKNKNMNLMFKENATNILEQKNYNSSNFLDIYITYIKFALNKDNTDLSHLYVCYKTCKKLIMNTLMNQFQINENIKNIHNIILELCFNCANNYPYKENINNNNDNNNNQNYEIKRKFILKEAFDLFKSYIKSKNKINLVFLTKNKIIELLDIYKDNSFIKLLLLYHIFEQRNEQFTLINIHKQSKFNFDIYKDNFFCYFDFIELYHDFFTREKNINFELENMLVVLMSQITKQFPEYNLFNNELINSIIKSKEKINFENFLEKNFFIENIKSFDELFFYKNPYKTCIIFTNVIFLISDKKKINFEMNSVNFYDLDKFFKCFNDFIENDLNEVINKEEKKIHLMNLFIKTCMIIFIFFSNDLIIFAPILEPDNNKLYKNLYKFFTQLINILFLSLKKYHLYINKKSKDKLITIINEICSSNPHIYMYMLQTYSLFNSEMIHFLVDNIPFTINCLKLLSFLYRYDGMIEPEFYLNSLIMFGYLVNKYPLKERFNNALDILNCLQKVINIRDLLKTEQNVDKFILGIYLIYKAYPVNRNEMKNFINFLNKEESFYEKKTKDKIDNLCNFIKKEFFVNDCYKNQNTLFVDINDFLNTNFIS